MSKKIGIIIDNITANAGTERAVSSMCNGLLKFYPELYEITVISIFSNKGENSFFELNSRINIQHLEIVKDFQFWNKVFWYKKLVTQIHELNSKSSFDLIMGTTYVHNILLPLIVKGAITRTIGCEHEVYNYPPKNLQLIRKFVYPKLDSVIVLNETEQNKYYFIKNTFVIPNSLPFDTEGSSSLTSNKIIAVGRLTHQKGFDMLIDLFEDVFRKAPNWELNIFGDGEDFESLESKIKTKGLEQQIKLCGSVKNISENYLKSSIFVLSSRWESFGIVIIEAMSHGLPIVSFECDGPKNLIEDNKSGFLIPRFDKNKFSEKLLLLINDIEKRKEMGKAALSTSLKYKEDKIIPLWNKLIQSILQDQQLN
jgi:glycosyltransferase involved in cell wall biosynthesis